MPMRGEAAQRLVRHLDEEEDLITPVILDQGERKLFFAPGPTVDDEFAEEQ
jgi:hypothetical protein